MRRVAYLGSRPCERDEISSSSCKLLYTESQFSRGISHDVVSAKKDCHLDFHCATSERIQKHVFLFFRKP